MLGKQRPDRGWRPGWVGLQSLENDAGVGVAFAKKEGLVAQERRGCTACPNHDELRREVMAEALARLGKLGKQLLGWTSRWRATPLLQEAAAMPRENVAIAPKAGPGLQTEPTRRGWKGLWRDEVEAQSFTQAGALTGIENHNGLVVGVVAGALFRFEDRDA